MKFTVTFTVFLISEVVELDFIIITIILIEKIALFFFSLNFVLG